MTKSRRSFLKKSAAATVGAGALTFTAPAVHARSTIRWRLQTYAGPALAAHVVKPAVDAFNQAANGEMEIELFYADQLVPTGDLFRAMQDGTIDAVQSDDDSMAAQPMSLCSAAIFRSPCATVWMCRCCSPGTVWARYGTRPMRKSG